LAAQARPAGLTPAPRRIRLAPRRRPPLLAALAAGIALLAALAAPAAAQVSAARIWPAPDYTRVAFESPKPLRASVMVVPNPERVVVDLEGIEPTAALEQLAQRVSPDDPVIRQVRVGRFRPGVVRVVFDLKVPATPQLFSLAPIAGYAHRTIVDLFPQHARDPVAAFLERQSRASADTPAGPPATGQAAADPAPNVPRAEARGAASRLTGSGRTVTIVIDPGHGGEDPGAIGQGGTREKDVVLAIGRRLQRLVDAEPGMRAVMTRDGDYFVPLHVRVARARAARGDLFVSIHADAWFYPHARGSSVYALSLSGASSAAARWLARRENEADLIGGVNLDVPDPVLKHTLLDLSQSATINDSLRLGRLVLASLGEVNRLHRKQVEQAGFAVLKAPDIPSILVETAFISNPEEEKRLLDEEHQERLAQAILAGIRKYFAQNPALARHH
jgi:N-acetylmuramoyl-L-alanine amidase